MEGVMLLSPRQQVKHLIPVLVLMFSVPTVCPMRWYWLSREPSSATTTDLVEPLVQT